MNIFACTADSFRCLIHVDDFEIVVFMFEYDHSAVNMFEKTAIAFFALFQPFLIPLRFGDVGQYAEAPGYIIIGIFQ